MKILAISDTHGLHGKLDIPEVDMIVFAGDAGTYKNPYQNKQSVLDFIEWFENLPVKYKIWTAGNHDTSIEFGLVDPRELCKSSLYLEHEYAEVGGVKIYASPWTPWFYDWAYNIPINSTKNYWEEIPENIDILVTHGPCKGILDRVSFDNKRVGDENLLRAIQEKKPKYHISGHIHENFGIINGSPTTYMNVAVVNDEYKLVNNGIVFEL